jgi:endonuclease YncB( thermonuclease family)
VKTIRPLSQSVLALSLFLAPAFAIAVLGQEPVLHGRVVAVTDGDTLKVLVAVSSFCALGLLLRCPREEASVRCPCQTGNGELAFSKDIELRPHAIDRYGRTVAQVVSDGKYLEAEMLRQGLARGDV